MKLSYKWLKEFVKIDVTPDQLAEDLNLFGHEVEEVKKVVAYSGEHSILTLRREKARRMDDWILDFSITANRGDCLSVLGLAREISALYNLKLKTKSTNYSILHSIKENVDFDNDTKDIKIKISDSKICSRYTYRIIDKIEIGPSPKWMKERLKSIGIRPINNIVDVTNYVMIETGQPLHSFDYVKIANSNGSKSGYKQINIRLARSGESVVTLDGKNRELDENSIIIEDEKKIFDLAGIMGGLNSEVDKNTKTIVLQAAVFDRKLLRLTSKRLKHMTDASYRYERGVDYEGTIYALDRASELIQQLCPQAKIGPLYDLQSKKKLGNQIKLDINKINNLLGTKLSSQETVNYLSRLNILTNQPINKLTNQLVFNIPSYRQDDLKIWQDLAEEIARIHGYNNLSKNLPHEINQRQSAIKSAPIRDQYILKENFKNILVKNGFTEVYSYSFADKKLMQILGIDLAKCRRVVNSVAPELEYLRYDLRPSILSAISKNPWAPEIKIFEIGKVFRVNPRSNQRKSASSEKWQLGIVITGKSDQTIKEILKQLKLSDEDTSGVSDTHPRGGQMDSSGVDLVKSVPQNILDHLKIRRPVKYAIIDLSNKLLDTISYQHLSVLESAMIRGRYRQISVFAPTIRDLAFIVDKEVDAEKIRSHITTLNPHILLVELFDEFYFSSAPLATPDQHNLRNMKNVAFHIWLQDLKGPMKEKEVDKIINKIIKTTEQKFQAKLRK